jgi:L-asparaginase
VLKPEFSKGIMLVRPYPGLDYSHLNLAGVAAILHDLYHSGTACVTEQWGSNYSLVEFVKRCKREGVTVYLAPAIKSANAYQTTRALFQQGAQMIWNMSVEVAYVKLMLAYGNYAGGQQITEFLAKDIADEHVVKFD